MLGLEAFGATGHAINRVGIVLVEAMLLYVVYGVLTTVVSGPLERVLQG